MSEERWYRKYYSEMSESLPHFPEGASASRSDSGRTAIVDFILYDLGKISDVRGQKEELIGTPEFEIHRDRLTTGMSFNFSQISWPYLNTKKAVKILFGRDYDPQYVIEFEDGSELECRGIRSRDVDTSGT